MSQIIRQPNGLYATFSTVSNGFTMWNCTVEDLIKDAVERETARIEAGIRQTVAELEAGERPYHQFTMDWKEAARKAKQSRANPPEELQRILSDASASPNQA